jgi:uncharacterized membrane protein YhaH (DUF805 family)
MDLGKILFSFNGRISRKQYIIFFLIAIIISFAFYILFEEKTADILLFVIFLWPSLSIQIKRLHDINKSGWYTLLSIIPIINLIMFVILLVRKGDTTSNKFGDPVLN